VFIGVIEEICKDRKDFITMRLKLIQKKQSANFLNKNKQQINPKNYRRIEVLKIIANYLK